MTIPTAPPSGFRDFLPAACALREQALAAIRRAYGGFGFEPIATSAAEDLAVLTGKDAGENEKLIFKILKRGEKLDLSLGTHELADLGLRFDLTLPLARYYVRHRNDLPHPFKALHVGPVWRAERAQKGRYREFVQCDADVIGSESSLCEVEVIEAMLAALDSLGIGDATVHLNDRRILFALLDAAGVPEDKRGAASLLLDKLDKMGRDAVLAELELSLGSKVRAALEKSVIEGTTQPGLIEALTGDAAGELGRIAGDLEARVGRGRIFLDFSLVRGFDYYTSTVFELKHPKLAGSLGGGGRYDHLLEKFGGPALPACGGSIGFERLMLILEEARGPRRGGPDVCVTVFSEELRAKTLELARGLRAAGLAADLFPGAGRLKAQFKYADAKGARFALILGPDEDAAGRLKLKDMRSGEEETLTAEQAIRRLKAKA